MMYLLLFSPLIVPITFYATARWIVPKLWAVHLIAAGLGGAAAGAFVGSAAAAMQSAVPPMEALARGGIWGFLVGVSVGLVALIVMWGLRQVQKLRRRGGRLP